MAVGGGGEGGWVWGGDGAEGGGLYVNNVH